VGYQSTRNPIVKIKTDIAELVGKGRNNRTSALFHNNPAACRSRANRGVNLTITFIRLLAVLPWLTGITVAIIFIFLPIVLFK